MLALKNLLRRKVRSLFAVLQIAIAIAAFVSIVGVTKGLRAQFYLIGKVFAFDLVIQPEGAASPFVVAIREQEAETVRSLPGVQDVSLVGLHASMTPGRSQPLTMLALEPGGELIKRYQLVSGRELREGDTFHLLVGTLMAEELDLGLGSRVRLGFDPRQECEVVGIFAPPLKDAPFLSGQAIMTLDHFRDFYHRTPNILAAHVAVGRVAESEDDVREGLELCRRVAPRIEEALPRMKARTIQEFLDSFEQAKLIDSFALAISFLAALVSGIGVANTMLMSVFDRTREIGLLRAIGWSRLRIVAMVQMEGILLALGGGLLGLPLGALLIKASQLLINLGWLDVPLDPPLYAQAVAFACLIGLAGSFYPALRAAFLQPTEALRYE